MMQPVRRLLSFVHKNPNVWSASRDLSMLGPSPLRGTTLVFDSFPMKPVFTRGGLSNICIRHLNFLTKSHTSECEKLVMHGKWMQNLRRSGRNLFVGGFLGISAIAGAMIFSQNVAYALNGHVEEHLSDSGDPSDFLKQDLDTVWELTKKIQLPTVLFLMVLFGWRHPIILAVNVALLLFCTRPDPFSIYIFIEQLRRRAMRQKPGLYKTKLFYAKKVEVRDYKLLCFAKVEVRDAKLSLIGILGSWWILQSSLHQTGTNPKF